MAVERLFNSWTKPALATATDYLCARYASGRVIDLSAAVVVLPTAEAARRLVELLVIEARRRDCRLVPPKRTITAGELPELLYVNKKPFASSLVQRLAWRRALGELPEAQRRLIVPQPPEADDLFAWLALGQLLADVHAELAGDRLTCRQVAERGADLFGPRERQRWNVLADLEDAYLRTLDAAGVWDKQTARLVALDQNECRAEFDIVLVATVDLNRTQRAMIEVVADRVTSLVFAPDELADRFDQLGCLTPAAWSDAVIEIPAAAVEVAATPGDQADAVVRQLADLGGKYSVDEIAIGLPDASLAPYVLQRLAEADVPARRVVGREGAQSSPGRLLAAVAELLESRQFADFAALVRHPDVETWLATEIEVLAREDAALDATIGISEAEGFTVDEAEEFGEHHDSAEKPCDLLTAIDRYYAAHLPCELTGKWFRTKIGRQVERAYGVVNTWLEPLRAAERPTAEWAEPIVGLVREVYGNRSLEEASAADHELEVACEAIVNAAGELELGGAASLAEKITGATALRLVVEQLATTLPPPHGDPAVRLVGWLDLPLDDAPVAIVTSLNEGLVPQARNGDVFLPNELRRRLGVEDNQRRYARDAYALSLLAASRARLKIIVGRRTAQGDPLFPSRLLFACPPAELAARVRAWFRQPEATGARTAAVRKLRAGRTAPDFPVPKPEPLAEPVTALRVTEFRDYLECPYRYYLRRRLKLERVDDSGDELAASDFGSLMHLVLARWGASDARDLTSADELTAEFNRLIDDAVARAYGRASMPAVRLQVEQLRMRLAALARWQAGWRQQGWRITYTEHEFAAGKVNLNVDGKPLALVGRVDRIDRHERSGAWAMFDYKTGDRPTTPDKAHRRNAAADGPQWIDLQLPLYRHLASSLKIEGEIRLGYIALPKDLDATGALLAEWSGADLAAAEATAAEVVRNIRAGRFWPPTDPPPSWSEDLAAICQDDQLGRTLSLDVDAEVAP